MGTIGGVGADHGLLEPTMGIRAALWSIGFILGMLSLGRSPRSTSFWACVPHQVSKARGDSQNPNRPQ